VRPYRNTAFLIYLFLASIEDFNKAKAVAISAGKSGAYLYPIKVSLWSHRGNGIRLYLDTEDNRASSTSYRIVTYGKRS
jgi:hypothetical protein